MESELRMIDPGEKDAQRINQGKLIYFKLHILGTHNPTENEIFTSKFKFVSREYEFQGIWKRGAVAVVKNVHR